MDDPRQPDTDAFGLGRLQRIENLREVWSHEASDFTPWLAGNIELLGEAIGVPLTVVGQEVHIGEFRLDIHAVDPDVIVEPNDWSKIAKQSAAAGVSEPDQARMDFFQLVFFQLGNDYPAIRAPRSRAASWWSFASGPFGYYALSFSRKGYRIEIYLDTQQKDSTKALFDHLHAARTEITTRLGFELDWERLDTNRGSRIACYYDHDLDPTNADEAELDAAAMWSATRVQAMHSHLDQELRDLARKFTTKEQLDVLGSVDG